MNKFYLLKKKFPEVDIIEYTDDDISNKIAELNKLKKASAAGMIKDESAFIVISNIVSIFVFYELSSYVLDSTGIKSRLEGIIPTGILIFILCSFFSLFILMSILVRLYTRMPKWRKLTTQEEAEFEIRAELCRPQLEKANDDLVIKIYNYCKSYSPIK